MPVNNRQQAPFIDIDAEVTDFVNDDRYSATSKMSKNISTRPNDHSNKTKKPNKYYKYLIEDTDDSGRTSVRVNQQAIDLYK